MFIQTQETPNPSTLKFIPGKVVLEDRTMQISKKEQASVSPLAVKLFDIDGVQSIFLGSDFISITKQEDISWDIIKHDILDIIMDHYVTEQPILAEEKTIKEVDSSFNNADPLVIQIKELIETRVRPAVAQDGGDIIFHSFENGVVKLELHGACSGCPSSTITLKNGIENMLKYYVPEVESVEAVN
tara:strand:+ start:694 stop:1251 length:558 start_codon:yes stop_codon:yes gene_type:complete